MRIALVLIMAGCVADLEDVSTTEQASCTVFLCKNSEEVAHYGLWEANLKGLADTNGIYIKSSGGRALISRGGNQYFLSVKNGRISGTRKLFPFGTETISGSGLAGADIELFKNGNAYFTIRIASVRNQVKFTVGAPDVIESYVMQWRDPGANPSAGKGLCNSPVSDKSAELLDLHNDETVVFEGDRVDEGALTMTQAANDDWFNFGCAGHTLAKLYLTRSTVHTQPTADWALRQAMLKMFTADYCGVGRPFTLAGEPIAFKGGLFPQYPAGITITTLDARWNQNGATCLYDPRLATTTNAGAPEVYSPDASVKDAIYAQCPALPYCVNHDPSDLDGSLLISVNRL